MNQKGDVCEKGKENGTNVPQEAHEGGKMSQKTPEEIAGEVSFRLYGHAAGLLKSASAYAHEGLRQDFQQIVAQAIRQARADGMREAADIAKEEKEMRLRLSEDTGHPEPQAYNRYRAHEAMNIEDKIRQAAATVQEKP